MDNTDIVAGRSNEKTKQNPKFDPASDGPPKTLPQEIKEVLASLGSIYFSDE